MFRFVAMSVAAAAMIAITAPPVIAGPAETAFLQKLSNTWQGRGQLSGAESGPISCRLVFASGGRNVKYQGRCAIPDMAAQAFSGSLSYNDQTGRYEARSAGGVVPGERRGDRLIFTTSSRNVRGTATSTMTISPSSLVVDFAMVDRDGGKTTSRITFDR